ncbi:MAG: hypothetical protein IIC67_10045 [Thaumarchaeota archaeon]|nr:hypothetical protein [Nitrososphaerota archaeon]
MGGAPKYVLNEYHGLIDMKYSGIRVPYGLPFDSTEYMVATVSGPGAEYAVAFALLYLGRKLDRTKHRTIKEASKVMSSLMSWFPFMYSSSSYIIKYGDYQNLADKGLEYFVTMPLTFLLGAGITYFNYKEYIPSLKDYLNDSKREESKERIRQKLIERKMKPGLRDRLEAKLRRKPSLEVVVDDLHNIFLNLEIFEDNNVSPEKWRMKNLSVAFESQEDTQKFIEDYLPR